MTINITLPTGSIGSELKPRITVIGVGGAGGNAVNNMIQSGLEGVEFLAANSDAQALSLSKSENRIQMGVNVTQGLGAGANPDIGQAAAEESLEEIISHIKDTNMVFITAGLGGGTGTGAAPVIAKAAREYGILTVGVVTKPFQFEGSNRMKAAEAGLEELQQYVDTLLIIPNQNLFRVANEKTTFADAFKMADDVLYSGVRGVTDLMVMPGLINLDFADIKSVMSEMGKAMMGTGEAEGEHRATDAAEQAIANPLLDDTSMGGAKGVLINITAGTDITLFEVDEAANRIRDEVDGDVNIIFGSTFDESLEGRVRVSVVATGIESASGIKKEPIVRSVIPIKGNETPSSGMLNKTDENMPFNNREKETSQTEATQKRETSEAESLELEEKSSSSQKVMAETIQEKETESFSKVEDKIPDFLVEKKEEGDIFIPAEPSDTSVSSAQANPFRAADMVNVSKNVDVPKKPRKSSGLSLFERVTGVARGEKKHAESKIEEKPTQSGATIDDTIDPVFADEPGNTKELIGQVQSELTEDPKVNENKSISQDENIKNNTESVGEQLTDLNSETVSESAKEPDAESLIKNIEKDSDDEVSSPQHLLGDLDPADRLSAAQEAEDVLDIPAFLRRQAN